MAVISLANGLKTLFGVLGCAMIAILIYTISIDGLPFRKELLTPWMAATLVDFYINVVPLAPGLKKGLATPLIVGGCSLVIMYPKTWVSYKESNWISAILWVILIVCFGSITTCLYIFIHFLKLSPQESLQDPIFHVLLRQSIKRVCMEVYLGRRTLQLYTAAPVAEDNVEHKGKLSSVVTARIIFSVLGFLMLGTLIYTLLTDGSPFRKELLTPWLTTTLIDFYINVVALSVWVAYKESSWIGAFFWIVLYICFGSISTCAYIVQQLLRLSSQDPLYLVLFNSGSRAENGYERPYGDVQ